MKNMREDSCTYEYSLGDSFFASIEAPEVRKGDLKAVLKVKKGIATYALDFHIEGTVVVPCDRCLDDMEVEVVTADSLKVKLGAEYSEEEDFIIVPEEDGFINVAWFMYEFIALSLPMKHTHAPGECNEEMMGTLSQHLRVMSEEEEELEDNWDEDTEEDTGDKEIDPRWNELKKILNNN